MKTGDKGIALIKKHEGLRLRAYLCPAKKPTIGYGQTGPNIKLGMVITKEEAEQLLIDALPVYERGVIKALGESAVNLKQEEFDAFISLAYNIGVAKFAKSSVCRLYKAGDKAKCANAFAMWDKARVNGKLVPLPGLIARRADEKRLFLSAEGEPTVTRSVSLTKTVEVPEASVEPEAPKSLSKSREIILGSGLGVGGVFNFLDTVGMDDLASTKEAIVSVKTEAQPLPLAQDLHIPEIASFLIFAVGMFMIWKRFSDRKNGIR